MFGTMIMVKFFGSGIVVSKTSDGRISDGSGVVAVRGKSKKGKSKTPIGKSKKSKTPIIWPID